MPLATRVGAEGINLQRLVYNGLGLATKEQSLKEIWWGARARDFRAAIQTDARPEFCRGCGVKWSL